ncbi:MAG: decaprenyl-phosphate phosphoribosyltransferase [Fimbriimonadales bacterium]|nr:decaprenyl-phosphate phosphoribosyltransferase [Fimbriimonadales bacterium]
MSQTRVAVSPMSVALALVQAMRPHQWIKNLLVFAALLFTAQFTNLSLLWQTVLGFFALCFTASSIYLVNDILDRERDRRHPKKQHRPIASGRLSVPVAWLGAAASLSLGLGLAFWLRLPFGVIVLAYALQSTLYTFYLKHIPLLDVGVIALGFLLRAASGAVLIEAYISPWLIICTFFLALFLGFAKRRHELIALGEDAINHRSALGDYSATMLEHLLTICLGLALQSYAIYVILSETAKAHPHLWYTLPVVTYGLLRYFYVVHRYDAGGSPEKLILSDKHIALSVLVWGLIVLWVMRG